MDILCWLRKFVIVLKYNHHSNDYYYMNDKNETAMNEATISVAYHDYAKRLTAHSYYKVHNKATSDDLVQDTFVKTWGYLAKGGKIETMKAFLYHVLNNLIIDEYRKHKTVSLDALIEKGYEPRALNPSERSLDVFDGKNAALMINSLPAKYQAVMRMRYVQDLSRNTVAVQTHRGLLKLRILYKDRSSKYNKAISLGIN